jgi:hypothetical protein
MGAVERKIGEYIHRQNSINRLKKSGLIFPRRVTVPREFLDEQDNLIIPEDVSDIPTEELGRYLSIFTSLASYYDSIVACADIDFTTAARVKDFIEAESLLRYSEKKKSKEYSSVTELKAARQLDEQVIKAQDWYDAQDAMFKLSKALLSGIERILFLLSREITRRGNQGSYEGRSYTVAGGTHQYASGQPRNPLLHDEQATAEEDGNDAE